MDEKTVVINESNGEYRIQNNGISEFELIGILECILFDMKITRRERSFGGLKNSSVKNIEIAGEPTAAGKELSNEQSADQSRELINEPNNENKSDKKPDKQTVPPSNAPELRTRIGNAVKAIKALGGEVDEKSDRSGATDEELKTELNELTEQYKRLKNSNGVTKIKTQG